MKKALPILAIAFILILIGGFLFSLNNPISLDDGLRHLAMAREMMVNGFGVGWQRFFFAGYFSQHLLDPWFLANISYIPVSSLPTEVALKIYTLINIALLIGAFSWTLRFYKLPIRWHVFLIFLLIFADKIFLYRLLLGRPFILITALLLIIFRGVIEKRWLLVSTCLLIATLFSQLFVFPFFIVCFGCGWLWLLKDRKSSIKIFASSCAAIVIGLMLHPHSLEYIRYLLMVFLRIPCASDSLILGTEMQSGYMFTYSVAGVIGICTFMTIVSLCLKCSPTLKLYNRRATTLLAAIAFVLLGVFYNWARGIDLLWPILILLLASFMELHKPFLKEACECKQKILGRSIPQGWLIVAVVSVLFCANSLSINYQLRKTDSDRALAHAEILSVIPSGSRVLNIDWDRIPVYLNFRPDLKYATGIDNTFTYIDNKEGYNIVNAAFSDAFKFDDSIIDVDVWINQLLKQYPSDYLLLHSPSHEKIISALDVAKSLKRISDDGSVFALYEIY